MFTFEVNDSDGSFLKSIKKRLALNFVDACELKLIDIGAN
jgi:hypothetical protein